MTSQAIFDDLETTGFHIIEGALSATQLEALRAALQPLLADAPFGANEFVGTCTKRIHSVFAKTRAIDDLAVDPRVLETIAGRLGDALLSASVVCEIHPGETAQAPHVDDGIYPLPADHRDVAMSALWALDDFTERNGATVVYPGSAGARQRRPDPASAAVVEMPAGSVLLYRGTLWHGGGANVSETTRRAVILTYVESWLRPQDAHLISVPPEAARALSPTLRGLLGYSMRPPFLGYVDGVDPQSLFDDVDHAGERGNVGT